MDKKTYKSICVISVVGALIVSILYGTSTDIILKLVYLLSALVGASESYEIFRTYKN